MNNKGKLWEKVAVNYLLKADFKVIIQNFNCRMGEIDIIALKGQYLHFIEVKYRKSYSLTSSAESVNKNKIKKIKKAAGFFLLINKKYSNFYMQFDVLCINGSADNIDFIENCFY
ncbi:MAG: YraN family protein [Candidatus Muiribacteriota bacterium]